MKLPDEFIFYPLGDVDDTNMRRFRITYEQDRTDGNTNGAATYSHIDYFEDRTTNLPTIIISDDATLQIDGIQVGDDMKSFESLGIQINCKYTVHIYSFIHKYI
jgi:hypothetical protein